MIADWTEERLDLNREGFHPIPKEQWGAFEIGDRIEVPGGLNSNERGPACPMCKEQVSEFYCVDVLKLVSRKPDGQPVWMLEPGDGRFIRAECEHCGYKFMECK